MDLQEQDIISGLQKGDKSVFDYLFRNQYARLCDYANGYLKSAEDSEELVQEVFINIWENHGKIGIHTSVRAYLYKCVHNACMNHLRLRRSAADLFIDEEVASLGNKLLFDEDPETIVMNLYTEQAERELEEAVESLPDQCREIFRLCRYENLSYPEVSSRLQVSLSTVKTQMSRAMDKLLKKMEKYF